MAQNETFRIEGMGAAIRQFRKAPGVARTYLAQAVQVTEISARSKVAAAAPRRTGALAHAVTSRSTGLKASISIEGGEIYGQTPSVYWRFVEFGTSRVPARPFIRASADAEQNPFIDRVKQAGARMERTLKQ